jgi:hypothetical protein
MSREGYFEELQAKNQGSRGAFSDSVSRSANPKFWAAKSFERSGEKTDPSRKSKAMDLTAMGVAAKRIVRGRALNLAAHLIGVC